MRRLGIFMIYDEQGIFDEYIYYMLDDMMQYFDRLVIACNGKMDSDARRRLEQYTDEILGRDNTGFDFGAWKEIIIDYLGVGCIREYDELVLFNDSFFGPITSFGNVFEKMESMDLDFWGLSVHGEVETVRSLCPYGYRPRYIQTYFVSFQKRILEDYSFENYWKNIPAFETFLEAGEKGSAVLTKYFEDLGFKWGVYSDTSDLETIRENNICQHAFNTYQLITERQYPIIKRKSFILGKRRFLKNNTGQDLIKALEYIENETEYNTDYIYKHLIRRFNMAELKETMNWYYILPSKFVLNNKSVDDKKVLIIAEIGDDFCLNNNMNLLLALPEEIMLMVNYVSDVRQDIMRMKERKNCFLKEIKKDESFFEHVSWKDVENYDYVCLLSNSNDVVDKSFVVGKALQESSWENLIPSYEYIQNIICVFEANKFLGVLGTPSCHHSTLFMKEVVDWRENYEMITSLLDKLGISVILNEAKALPLNMQGFWCRPNAIKMLFTEEFVKNCNIVKKMELVYPYVAQSEGYFSGSCMSSEYAATEYENLYFMISKLSDLMGQKLEFDFSSFENLCMQFKNVDKLHKELEKCKDDIKKLKSSKKNERIVEVPVLVNIGVKGAVKNWINKKLGLLFGSGR